MANNLTFNPTQLPTFARNRSGDSSLTKALAGGASSGGGYPHRISIKGGVFRLIADGKQIAALEERYMDAVIVNAAPSVQRQFYSAKFDENATTAPSCWSSDGTKPDEDVREAPSTSCAMCPNNIKGSGTGDSKACRFQQRIALVLANDLEGNVLQLVVPGRSLFGKEDGGNYPLQAYARYLEAQKIEPTEVVTRIRFDTSEASPKLFFKTTRWLTDDEFSIVDGQKDTSNAKAAVLMNSKTPATTAAPVARIAAPIQQEEAEEEAPKPKAKAKAKPKVEEPEDEEPVVRKTAETPTIPARKGMASIVAEWDTDD